MNRKQSTLPTPPPVQRQSVAAGARPRKRGYAGGVLVALGGAAVLVAAGFSVELQALTQHCVTQLSKARASGASPKSSGDADRIGGDTALDQPLDEAQAAAPASPATRVAEADVEPKSLDAEPEAGPRGKLFAAIEELSAEMRTRARRGENNSARRPD